MVGENNTVDQMPKKNSFQLMNNNNNRGSTNGNDNMIFQSLNPHQMS